MANQIPTEFEIRKAISQIRTALDRRGPIRPNIWGFYSNKNHKLLTLLGDVTFIQAVLLEGDRSVRSYCVSDGVINDETLDGGRELQVDFADDSQKWYFCGR